MSLAASPWSVPEPDVAVVLGGERDYIDRHPGTALLVVEVAISTVAQDRLTKAAIYAQAGVKNYWIVQPADGSVVVHSRVRPEICAYEQISHVRSATVLMLDEIERIHDWAARLKGQWDELKRRRLRIDVIASGSSALRLVSGSKESLAGRFERLTLGH